MSSLEGRKPQRRPSALDLAARDLTLAAQGSPSRPGSTAEPSYRATERSQTPSNTGSRPPPQTNSPFNDPKFAQGCDALGRRPSAVRLGFPDDFYRTATASPAGTFSGKQTPAQMSRTQTPDNRPPQNSAAVQRWLDGNPEEPKAESEDIGLCTYEIQAKRLSMARLWAAKTLIEHAYEHKDLDSNAEKPKRPLYPYRDQVEEIMFQLTDVVQYLGNDKLVRDYEKAYTIPKESKYYGKGFVKVVPNDATKMLAAAQGVADQIVREIR